MAKNAPVAPELLEYVDDYIDETAIGSALHDDLDSDSNLIVFCRELFAQLFANVIGEAITGVGSVSAERANVLRRKAGRTWPRSLRRLIGHFQHFCKVYEDLLGEGYSGGSETRAEFHFDFLPTLLSDLKSWADEAGHAELAGAVDSTGRRYHEYLSSWEPRRNHEHG